MLTFLSVTNSFLAMPQADSTQVISVGLTYERDAFTTSPDKVSDYGDVIYNMTIRRC